MGQNIQWLAALAFGAFGLFNAIATQAQTAPGVRIIDRPQPTEIGKIEVIEFFAYGCGHCAALEAPFEVWRKKLSGDVKVIRIPSNAPLAGVDSSVIFYTLEALGQLERLHEKIFAAIHQERVMLGHEATRNKWLEKQGVDTAKFAAAEKSFAVTNKIRRAIQLAEVYRIESIPTLVVNGRFAITPDSGSPQVFLASADSIITRARTTANKP